MLLSDITPEEWTRAKAIFGEAVDLPPDRRRVFLDKTPFGGERVRTLVFRLLLNHERAQSFLSESALSADAGAELAATTPALAPDQILCGRFVVGALLGRGGMGEVYQAYDRELQESVALKVLRTDLSSTPRALDVLRREVRQARRVRHPNVCRVDDLFTDTLEHRTIRFLSMELLNGESLNAKLQREGRMSLADALPRIAEMVAGLESVHGAGMLHGDFKSSNVMLVPMPEGSTRAVVADFGLSRNIDVGTAPSLRGAIEGTPEYMAPEQLRGDRPTPASDVYSLGVVMYEMVTGSLPYGAISPLGHAVQKLNAPPERPRNRVPGLDPRWEAVLLRCLELEPARRFETPARVLEALTGSRSAWQIRSPRPTRRVVVGTAAVAVVFATVVGERWFRGKRAMALPNSLAVLPFEGAPGDDPSLVDGIAEELIHELSRTPRLRVINRQSVLKFRNVQREPRQIAGELNVSYLVLGRLRRSEGKVELHAQLIQAGTGFEMWSRSYSGAIGELPRFQREVAAGIRMSIGVEEPGERRRFTNNPEAYDAYLRGRYHWNRRNPESVRRSLEYYAKAVAIDSDFALAYTGIADAYSSLYDYASVSDGDLLVKAKNAAGTAIAKDAFCAEAYASLGLARSLDLWDWSGAEECFRQSLARNSGLASARHSYAALLCKLGRSAESIAEIEKALDLDPLAVPIGAARAWLLYYSGRFDEAIHAMQSTVELDPSFVNFHSLYAYCWTMKLDRGRAVKEARLGYSDQSPYSWVSLAWVYASVGMVSESRALLSRLTATPGIVRPSLVAGVLSALGDLDQAFAWIDKAWSDRDGSLLGLKVYPYYRDLRADARYAKMLAKIGLPA